MVKYQYRTNFVPRQTLCRIHWIRVSRNYFSRKAFQRFIWNSQKTAYASKKTSTVFEAVFISNLPSHFSLVFVNIYSKTNRMTQWRIFVKRKRRLYVEILKLTILSVEKHRSYSVEQLR